MLRCSVRGAILVEVVWHLREGVAPAAAACDHVPLCPDVVENDTVEVDLGIFIIRRVSSLLHALRALVVIFNHTIHDASLPFPRKPSVVPPGPLPIEGVAIECPATWNSAM